MTTRKLRKLSSIAALGALSALTGCGAALVEAPYYNVSEVQSFKVAGAPNQIMMLDIVDANDTLDNQTWADALSNHGYPPRLNFVTDAADISDTQTIKPENRLVVVVNPTQTTMHGTLCTDPQSAKSDGTSDRVTVRFGFCAGDDIISETRARLVRDKFEQQVINSADTISFQLFPRHIRDEDDDNCSRRVPGC